MEDWEAEVKRQPNMSSTEVHKFLLSRPTIEGWKITVKSFVLLCKELFRENYDFVLSRKLVRQDQVEQFFARHRQSCGGNQAPSFAEFANNTHLFKITKQTSIPRGANSKENDSDVLDFSAFKKRRH